MTFGQWINKTDTQEASEGSIASVDAVQTDKNEDQSARRIQRSLDYNKIESHKEEGRVHEKIPKVAQPRRANDNKKVRLIVGVIAALFVLVGVIVAVIEVKKKQATAIPEDDLFDFSDIEETYGPTTSITRNPTLIPIDITKTPTPYPSTQAPTIPLTESPTTLPSLVPSTSPPTISNEPSGPVSSTPTYFPSNPIKPVARPPIIPFLDEESDSFLTFCVIADVPYTTKELDELPGQIATQMKGCEFLVHLGDIFVGDTPCNIEDYETIRDIMLESHAPAFLVPGDNEWNDCLRSNIDSGWNHWTNHFVGFENNWNHTFSIVRQPGYEENFYFIEKKTLVFGINIVGGRVHNETEWETRLKSEYSWVRDIILLNLVGMKAADGVIVMAHAHPSEDHRDFFNPFRVFIRDELKNEFPVLYLHGDGHSFIYTPNYHDQSNFLRIQHEGGTNDPVLKIMAGPGRGPDGRSSVYDAFQYDRQLELRKTNMTKD